MFDITPIARDRVFADMKDPVIVIDTEDRIADFNNAACGLITELASATGKNLANILKDYSNIIELYESKGENIAEIELDKGGELLCFDFSVTGITSAKGESIGTIITLHDITTQKQLFKILHNQATIDELTGLQNRRHFIEKSKHELWRARRYDHQMSIFIIDLDFFKRINDTYGHQAGDKVLIETAGVLKAGLRTSDESGRYGGEEFAVILPETSEKDAELIASRLRESIASMQVDYEGKRIMITASIGISFIDFGRDDKNENIDEVLKRLLLESDKALYQAKGEGRNRVVIYQSI